MGEIFKQKKQNGELETLIREHSGDLDESLHQLSAQLPVTGHMRFEKAPEKIKNAAEGLDAQLKFLVYTANLYFSPSMKSSVFYPFEQYKYWARTFAKSSGTTIIHNSLPDLESSTDYFSNVVMPLIANVQQHAYRGSNESVVDIKADVDERKKEITVKVRDYGVGIIPKVAGRLFEKGASTKTDTHAEHGIGLWATKEFIERNGGRIWFESAPKKGTTFYFTIPYRMKINSMYRQIA